MTGKRLINEKIEAWKFGPVLNSRLKIINVWLKIRK
jgi:uncharacterized phage-associated protein